MLLFDLLLGLGLLGLAVLVVAGRTLFASVVVYTVFGLLMAVAWARLGAPDLALAEAAIGAGLTGAMLMLTYRRLIAMTPERAAQRAIRSSRLALPLAVASGSLTLVLLLVLLDLPIPEVNAGDLALTALPDSPVGNPVTAVLLLYRGYDTLLEMLVLLVAWLGVAMVQRAARSPAPEAPRRVPLLDALLAAVVPSAILVGGYLLHVGGKSPGGAFQAGAVLAAAGVLLALSERIRPVPRPVPILAWLLVLGLMVFSVLALSPLAGRGAVMALGGMVAVYAVEAAMTVSIAATLVLLFLGTGGVERRR